MKSHNEQLAQKVVEAFKQHISAEARALITEMEYQELSQIVQEALSLEMAEAVEMVDELERRLKQRAERRELEL